jgi:protein arginine N-methyltransferase 5
LDWWELWNQVRSLCGHSPKLGVVLDVPAALPPEEEVMRWHGEPVKAVMVPTSVFQTNKRGFPALSRAHQELLTTFFQQGVQVAAQSGIKPSRQKQDSVFWALTLL